MQPRRAAFVVNPTKLGDGDGFRSVVRQAMREHGCSEPLWLETTAADPGRGPASEAVAAGADLGLPSMHAEALAVGLDGTDQPIDVGTANGTLFVVMAASRSTPGCSVIPASR